MSLAVCEGLLLPRMTVTASCHGAVLLAEPNTLGWGAFRLYEQRGGKAVHHNSL
jgi:hypothetical protein